MPDVSDARADALNGLLGPRGLAARLEDDITDMQAQLEVATTRAERSRLNKAIHRNKGLIRWCKTRAGY